MTPFARRHPHHACPPIHLSTARRVSQSTVQMIYIPSVAAAPSPPLLPPLTCPDVCTGNPMETCFYDPTCSDLGAGWGGGLGCNAGGQGQECRFCGFSIFPPCPGTETMSTTLTAAVTEYCPAVCGPSEADTCGLDAECAAGLLTDRCVLAHAMHLDESELQQRAAPDDKAALDASSVSAHQSNSVQSRILELRGCTSPDISYGTTVAKWQPSEPPLGHMAATCIH